MNSKVIDLESRLHLSKNPSNRTAIAKKSEFERKKLAAFASLASVVVLVTVANITLMSQKETTPTAISMGRGIASVSDSALAVDPNIDASKLLKEIEDKTARGIASLGQAPTTLEYLRFGVLEGKYALRSDNGKITELEFIEAQGSVDRPKYIPDKEAFLMRYRDLMKVKFAAVSKGEERLSGNQVLQTVEMRDEKNVIKGRAIFESDLYGRVIRMKISE